MSVFLITRFGGERVDGAQGSSGYQPGRPHASKKEPLKFDDDYDFEQANEQFQEFCSKFEVTICFDLVRSALGSSYQRSPLCSR